MRGECIICGKPAEKRVPYTICKNCREIIYRWEDIKDRHKATLKKTWGISPIEMPKDDLQIIADRISDIEENIHWIKNVLRNIARTAKQG